MKLEPIEGPLRSKTGKALRGLIPLGLSALTLWLAPTPALKASLIAVYALLWIVLWGAARLAVLRKEIRRLQGELESLRGVDLKPIDWTVLRYVFSLFPDQPEEDEMVSGVSLERQEVLLSLRRLVRKKFLRRAVTKSLWIPGQPNPNGYGVTPEGQIADAE